MSRDTRIQINGLSPAERAAIDAAAQAAHLKVSPWARKALLDTAAQAGHHPAVAVAAPESGAGDDG